MTGTGRAPDREGNGNVLGRIRTAVQDAKVVLAAALLCAAYAVTGQVEDD